MCSQADDEDDPNDRPTKKSRKEKRKELKAEKQKQKKDAAKDAKKAAKAVKQQEKKAAAAAAEAAEAAAAASKADSSDGAQSGSSSSSSSWSSAGADGDFSFSDVVNAGKKQRVTTKHGDKKKVRTLPLASAVAQLHSERLVLNLLVVQLKPRQLLQQVRKNEQKINKLKEEAPEAAEKVRATTTCTLCHL